MNDTVNHVEDQPQPATDEQVAQAEMNGRMQAAVQGLGNALMRKFQLSGNQFNALDLELKVLLLVEQIQLLAALVIELSAGRHSDASLTEAMIERVDNLVAFMQKSMDGPKLVLPSRAAPARAMNGGKRN